MIYRRRNAGNFNNMVEFEQQKATCVCVFRPLAMRKILGLKNIRMRFLSIRAVRLEISSRGNMYLIHK
jgi:hypothetical protein